jgi:hypothetical protein
MSMLARALSVARHSSECRNRGGSKSRSNKIVSSVSADYTDFRRFENNQEKLPNGVCIRAFRGLAFSSFVEIE